MFENIDDDDDDYYKPILDKSCFNENYKYYESRGDKDKKLSPEQYLDMIKAYLTDLTNDHKSKEWKIQINMHITFVSSHDTEKLVLFFYGVIMKKLGWVMKQMALLKDFLIFFK